MRWSWTWLPGFVLLGSTAASGPSPVGGDGRGDGSDDGDDLIAVEARDGGIELEKLLALVADVTGEPFFFDRAALHGLRARPIEAKAIPRKRLLPYLDDQLREADCVIVERIVAGVRCHRVASLQSSSRAHSDLKSAAEIVTPDELASIADRWKLVTTGITLRSIGLAEGMEHTLCYRHSDSAQAAIRRMQGTSTYVITGPAGNLAQEVALMRELDAAGIRSEIDEKEKNYLESLDRRIAALEAALAGR